MSGSFSAGWVPGDPWISAEVNKIWACFYDHTTAVTDASLAVTPPTGGVDLRFEYQTRGDASTSAMRMRVNGDTGANYQTQFDTTFSTTDNVVETTGLTAFSICTLDPAGVAGSHSSGWISIPNYRDTTFWTTITSHAAVVRSAGAAGLLQQLSVQAWFNTAAITAITFLPDAGNFAAGSRIRGYVSAG